ncbi:VOC family protein [Changchengzhania lutea]|uniref:hypothetical protein n=1 Tax=Changchengzhania lutea TaxID=2049305 RepID=UPI00163DCFBB|nr:hypothetical protein [Changchengzhania lutea]
MEVIILIKTLNNVETLSGKIINPKALISEDMGSFALFIDSEGNKLGIYFNNG